MRCCLSLFLQTRLNFALNSLGIHKGFLQLLALKSVSYTHLQLVDDAISKPELARQLLLLGYRAKDVQLDVYKRQLGLSAHKSSALAGLNMLELNDLKDLAVLLKSYTVTKFACRDHIGTLQANFVTV